MSEDWWKRRRKKRSGPWFDEFEEESEEEFDRLGKTMEEAMRRAFETSPKSTKTSRPYIYGFSMSVGPDGKPVIREFGNVHSSRFEPRVREEREPLMDIMEEERDVVIVAEVPGVEKNDINLHTTEESLTISVDTPQRKYRKELALPTRVYPKSAKVSYKNGVLEVHLRKLVEKAAKGKGVFAE